MYTYIFCCKEYVFRGLQFNLEYCNVRMANARKKFIQGDILCLRFNNFEFVILLSKFLFALYDNKNFGHLTKIFSRSIFLFLNLDYGNLNLKKHHYNITSNFDKKIYPFKVSISMFLVELHLDDVLEVLLVVGFLNFFKANHVFLVL